MNHSHRPRNPRRPRNLRLSLSALLFWLGSACADPSAVINTDPDKLIGQQILFFKLDHTDVKLLEPACVVPLTNGGRGNMWFNMTHNHPLLDDPRYTILRGADSMHHFCRGQAAKIRYFKERDPVMKKRLLEEMIGEYVFMISHPEWLPKNWAYMKRMHLELGNARILEKKPGQAMRSFEQALSLDPAYEQAHIAYADALTDMGQKDKALARVTEGLKHNPESKGLQRRYQTLGGKLPFPEPYKKVEPAAGESVTDAPAVEGDKVFDAAPTKPSAATEAAGHPESPLAARPAPSSEVKQAEMGTVETVTPTAPESGQIGTPENPYCRFCP